MRVFVKDWKNGASVGVGARGPERRKAQGGWSESR